MNKWFEAKLAFPKSILHYTHGVTPKRVTGIGGPFPWLSAWQYSPEGTLEQWRIVADAASDLTGPGIEPQTFRTNCYVFNRCALLLFTYVVFATFRWFPEVQNIYYQGNKRKHVPDHRNEEKLKSFFNCAATLMTEQLQNLCLHSIEDFANLIVQPPVRCFENKQAHKNGCELLIPSKLAAFKLY